MTSVGHTPCYPPPTLSSPPMRGIAVALLITLSIFSLLSLLLQHRFHLSLSSADDVHVNVDQSMEVKGLIHHSSPTTNITAVVTVGSKSDERTSKLADGCYHVFLDVGSNIGMHARFLYETTSFPRALIARTVFMNQFGPEQLRDNRDICIFSFEPNPSHNERHAEMRKLYAAMGWRYYPINAGVGDADGSLTFYHVGDDLGFTTLKSSCRKECISEQVHVYRLSDWIDREVHGREVPATKFSNDLFQKGPRVVMKMVGRSTNSKEFYSFPLHNLIYLSSRSFASAGYRDDGVASATRYRSLRCTLSRH